MNRIRPNKIERVACYIRVSTQEQKLHGISLDAQVQKLTEYAKKHNMKIVEWYKDEGVSGRKLIRKRPELQRMIQDAEQGKFDRIIFIKLDRFFRSVAEYHECMKRIAPVIWTTTEEEYDLSTANGRMLVNMKLTIAEMEADQGGERIKIVNEYKASTGQPLSGSMPFGYMIGKDEETGRKNVIKDPDEAPILEDMIQHFLLHQSKRKLIIYLHTKYHLAFDHQKISRLFSNTMLYGTYRDNPNYCEPYIDKETFDRLQDIDSRNIKESSKPNRAYLFTGIMKCPKCGRTMGGNINQPKSPNGKRYPSKRYRCPKYRVGNGCDYSKSIFETTLEKVMLDNIERYLEEAKISNAKVEASSERKAHKYDLAEIHAEIDRLNYSWQKGRVKVEVYEKQYDELMEKLHLAEEELNNAPIQDFAKIEAILQSGWKEIYNKLEDENKRAFWRSFIKSFEPDWDGEKKEVKNLIFF
jgi:DNA invertase Pin-like site-specific DNA recombinase